MLVLACKQLVYVYVVVHSSLLFNFSFRYVTLYQIEAEAWNIFKEGNRGFKGFRTVYGGHFDDITSITGRRWPTKMLLIINCSVFKCSSWTNPWKLSTKVSPPKRVFEVDSTKFLLYKKRRRRARKILKIGRRFLDYRFLKRQIKLVFALCISLKPSKCAWIFKWKSSFTTEYQIESILYICTSWKVTTD